MKFIISIIASFILFGCTQNNGNIGNLFGQWQLKEIITQESSINPEGRLFIAFQNNIILFKEISHETHGYTIITGNYKQNDNILSVNLFEGNPDVLNCFLITNKKDPVFFIKELDRNLLIIVQDGKEWIYRKY